jgi:hypothetical protein
MVACEFLISTVQAVLALRRFALRNFSHTNFYDEAHTNCIVRHPDVKSLIRNLPNKNENAKDETSPSKSVSQNVSQSLSHPVNPGRIILISLPYALLWGAFPVRFRFFNNFII